MEQSRIAPSQPRPAAPAQPGTGANGKPAADENAPGKTGGFALLLAALGAAAPQGESAQAVDASALQDGAEMADGRAADWCGAAADAAQAPDGAPQPPARKGAAADPLAADGSLAGHLNLLLQQAQRPAAEGAAPRGSLVGETARLDGGTAEPVARATPGRAAAAGPGPRAGAAAWSGAAPSTAAGAAPASGAAGDAGALLPASAAQAASAAAPLNALPASAAGAAQDGGRVSVHEAPPLGHWAGANDAPVAPLALADAAAVLRSRTASPAGSQAGDGAAGGDGAGLRQAPPEQPAGAGGAPDGLPGDGRVTDDFMERLSEQVTFWVHQKTQRAELTLDHDGQAVQVRVALDGDATSVAFRSDHAAARQALDAGLDDLRSLLRDQGLELAQVSVGVAGGQGGGAARQDAHAGAHREGGGATARVAAPAPPPGRPEHAAAGRRALDVFV